MANGRCRIHGGASTGPITKQGVENIRQTHMKHGQRTAEAIRQRKEGMALRREIKRLLNMADNVPYD